MKSVVQNDSMGCAVACVAFVTNHSYSQALRLFELPNNAGRTGYYCNDIIKALKKGREDYTYNYLKSRKKFLLLFCGGIVYLRKSKRYPRGHYLARAGKSLWMDPWKNFPKTPRKSGFRKRLPEKAIYILYPKRFRL